ncbi:DUF2141 domain-containing protein [Sphingomonas donggukensis]|uniref:DUF2141 domain-containing protein n=1 Tax=Sphingomonas donggukensis TaxID=2949093 RepID=A0ABY4TWC5_9SPHN|nr:DUF2141 domain-containing protein [Sphingomonas donggukensis]URW76638.1 DUF2141 domain-containing protein [Sphingomonas donggukensis]
MIGLKLLLGATALVAASPAIAGDVVVTLSGVKPKGGSMVVALYDANTFFKARPPYMTSVKVPADGVVTVTLPKIPAGDYAVSAFHDADGNGTLTMKDGRMAEGTALSNAEKLRGAPTFDVTRIAIPATGAAVRLAMSYPEDRSGW